MRCLRVSAVALLAALACLAPSLARAQYTVHDLGNLAGFTFPSPAGINNRGVVVGSTSDATFTSRHAFRTAPNSAINPATDDLGGLTGFNRSSATGVNNSGQVSGFSQFPASPSHAFRLDPGSPLVDLGSAVAGGSSLGNAINDLGQVAGAADFPGSATCLAATLNHAFRTTPNGTVAGSENLGTLLPGNCRGSTALAINSSGQVAGSAAAGTFLSPVQHAFLSTPGFALQDLGTLGGPASVATSINDFGVVVGSSNVAGEGNFDPPSACFIKVGAAAMQNIGTLGGTFCNATDVNNAGQVVGLATTAGDAAAHAFLYQDGVMTDLNDLLPPGSGWVLVNAASINDVGQIVGTGQLNGVFAAFRLDPPANVGVTNLITTLGSPSLNLSTAEVTSLSAKLGAALFSLGRTNTAAAGGQIGAFINLINALVNSGRLSAADAAPLLDSANNVLSSF